MVKKVNIIGAGLAGLSAGIYLQQRGVATELFEMAPWAGGVCTAWVRDGYRFDGCIHWMMGTKPGPGFYQLYREVDALTEDTEIYNPDSVFMEIGGVMYEMPLELAGFKQLLLRISPQDEIKIKELCRDIDILIHNGLPAGSPQNLGEFFSLIKHGRGLLVLWRKYLGLSVEEYCRRFESETLRDFIYALMPQQYSTAGLIMMLGVRMAGDAGYPRGGALDMIKRMQEKYLALGGKQNFNAKVDEIVVKNGRAAALTANGSTHPADAVIAACDAHDVLANMLGGKYAHPQLDKMLEQSPLFSPLALVSFGLDKRFAIPYSLHYEYPEGIRTAPGVRQSVLDIRSFDFDPEAAPEGCSSVMAMLTAPLEYWQYLYSTDREGYNKEKEELAQQVAAALDERIPGFKEAVKVINVATPATYVRLANLYRGSFEGFAPTPANLKAGISPKVPGIGGLLLCGQWTVAGGGICTAIKSGKDAAHAVMKELK